MTYTPPPGFSDIDRFGFTVSDGRGGTASAEVVVTVSPPSSLQGTTITGVTSPSGGAATVRLLGLPNTTYGVERSAGLPASWNRIGSVTTGSNGLGVFADNDPPGGGVAVYRVVYP